jgi:hypothetical protein
MVDGDRLGFFAGRHFLNVANFSKEQTNHQVRYGTYYSQNGETYISVGNNGNPAIDMTLRQNTDPSAPNTVLEWTSGTVHSIMLCVNVDDTDVQPVRWVDPPNTAPTSTPVEAYVPPEPDVKTIVDPAQSASSGFTVSLSSDGVGGHTVDVVLGTNTPVTMLIDTGATLVSLPQNIADQLVSVGDATVVDQGSFKIADGTSHTQNIIDIGKFTIGGHTLYHIKASVGPSDSMMLLGTNVLNTFGKYSIDAANNN